MQKLTDKLPKPTPAARFAVFSATCFALAGMVLGFYGWSGSYLAIIPLLVAAICLNEAMGEVARGAYDAGLAKGREDGAREERLAASVRRTGELLEHAQRYAMPETD